MNNAFLLLLIFNIAFSSDRFISKMKYNIDRLYSTEVDVGNKTVELIVSTTSGFSWVDFVVINKERDITNYQVKYSYLSYLMVMLLV